MLLELFQIESAEFSGRTMGCFFGCFRVRDDRRTSIHLLSKPISSNLKDPVESVARNRLSSLLLFEAEDRDQSLKTDRKCSVQGSDAADMNLNELKAEAKFLKDCGTLPQTPAEIRNNDNLKDLEPNNGNTESSRFHSWLQNNSQPSSIKLFDEWENESDTLSQSPDRAQSQCSPMALTNSGPALWLPPKQLNQGCNNRQVIGKTPGDRPILGMVAAHWKADETVVSTPTWWDGNGIPNSTNKYKEKVSWHATLFEERLEKALSEDKFIAERKELVKMQLPPIDLDGKEEKNGSSHFESGFILINSS